MRLSAPPIRRRAPAGSGPAGGPCGLALCLLLLAAGCGGESRPGDGAGRSPDTAGADVTVPDTGVAAARNQTGAPATADTPAPADSIPAGDTAVTPPPDSPAAGDTAAASSDTAVVGRFYVRVRAAADPDSVARRHGVRPLSVVREPTKGFYAALTGGQVAALESDTLVQYVAREIHGPDTIGPPPMRRAPVRDTGRDTTPP